jgi:hypothetical protein
MIQKIKLEGKCLFCGKTFAKAGINRHLKTHLDENEETEKSGVSYLVKVKGDKWAPQEYFLSLWVNGEAKMKDVYQFLRDIWLECCGYLSAFRNPKNRGSGYDFLEVEELLEEGKIKEYEELMEETQGEVPMSRKVKNVFYKDLKLEYEYDFGSSTCLKLTVIEQYPVKADKKIVLLSRNEPIEWLCDKCGKALATQICSVHIWDEASKSCNKCVKKHAKECADFVDYTAMPVVNSLRTGGCAYDGGCIDMERDGVFMKK